MPLFYNFGPLCDLIEIFEFCSSNKIYQNHANLNIVQLVKEYAN